MDHELHDNKKSKARSSPMARLLPSVKRDNLRSLQEWCKILADHHERTKKAHQKLQDEEQRFKEKEKRYQSHSEIHEDNIMSFKKELHKHGFHDSEPLKKLHTKGKEFEDMLAEVDAGPVVVTQE
jgi:hypothetical protein